MPRRQAGVAASGPIIARLPFQTYLSMKVRFGMTLHQTTGFFESFLRLVGLDWSLPDFSTLSRHRGRWP